MTYPVTVQAAYDANNLYVRLTFKAPAGGADHSDKDNEVKATMMFPNDKVPLADQAGCWSACHEDSKGMPKGKDKTKYVSALRATWQRKKKDHLRLRLDIVMLLISLM